MPPNSYVEALIPIGMISGDETFGRELGLDEAMQLCPMMGLVSLYEEEETPGFSLCVT